MRRYYEAVKRFQHVLDASGVNTALSREGVREGDAVVIGQVSKGGGGASSVLIRSALIPSLRGLCADVVRLA